MRRFSLPHLSRKKLVLFGFIAVLVIAIPLTIYLVQQQQEVRSHAQKSTTVSLTPTTKTAAVNAKFTYDIMVDPGVNQVNFLKLVLNFDSTKMSADGADSFTLNSLSNATILDGPTSDSGSWSITLSEDDATKPITTLTRLGTITFTALDATSGPSDIAFDQNLTVVRSLGATDTGSENVLSSANGASVTITGSSNNQVPTCQDLNIDKDANGTAPYTLKFTATGTDEDGTVSKISINFGGDEGIATPSGSSAQGLDTAIATASASHTFSKAGTYNAFAIVQDDKAGVSDQSDCTQTITVDAAAPTNTPTPTPTGAVGGPNPTATPTPTSGSTSTNAVPVCTALSLDGDSSGNAPFAVTMTATGDDSDGTITKVTFNYGDSQTEDVTQSGGIGTESVSAQVTHTYQNPGTYTASATLTDDGGGVSTGTTCKQTITVTGAGATGSPTPTPLPATGPGATIMGIGAIGAALFTLGAILFLIL